MSRFGGGLFGGRDQSPQQPPRDPYAQRPPGGYTQAPSRGDYDTPMNGYDGRSSGHSPAPSYQSQPPLPSRNMQQPPRQGGHQRGGSRGQMWRLSPVKSPDNSFTFRNLVAVSSQEFPPSREDIQLIVNGMFVVSARTSDHVTPGSIGLSSEQRTWMGVALTDVLQVEMFDIFSQTSQAYLGSMDIEVGFASKSKAVETPYDQDELAKEVIKVFQNQVFAPGQRFLMDVRSIPLTLAVKTVQLMDLNEKGQSAPPASRPDSRGIMTPHTQMNFFKDPKSTVNLKASSRRPAANAIIAPDFKFEDMGIGGLDAEFSTIFRRAFASRICECIPSTTVMNLGINIRVASTFTHGPC